MSKRRVFLTGTDDVGWALDEDLRLARQALDHVVDLVGLPECEVVRSCWWEHLLAMPPEHLEGKRLVCQISGEPSRWFTLPAYRKAVAMVGRWITRTVQAKEQMKGFGIETVHIPYLVDVETFNPLPRDDERLTAFRSQWDIPDDAYLIGSFQRDTEGADLSSPKLVKGPDVLLEILRALSDRGKRIHAVLAGPRRHWLIGRCEELGIPFTYVGSRTAQDDIRVNTLERSTVNLLYNLVDLSVVASRSEGGPHAILEAAAAGCAMISSAVGTAPDVLEPECVYRDPAQAVDLILRDMADGFLRGFTAIHRDRIEAHHRPLSAVPLFRDLYDTIASVPVYRGVRVSPRSTMSSMQSDSRSPVPGERPHAAPDLTVGLWHTFFKPPYGGGNQFMMALRKAMLKLNVVVRDNELTDGIDAYILNSIHFDVERFLEFRARHRLNVIHRIDGPIHLIRGFDREKDELCFRLNEQFASATVLQSAWTYQRIVDMGYQPVNPVIVRNAVDSDIFHPEGRIAFDRKRKIRLISSSWSNNPRKGGSTYKWIEDHLDWDRFEYTFVGNASGQFSRIRHVPPVSSEDLAQLLRRHDIYITASRNDPCSNALIEALACGLPALYYNDGGHPELVGQGGLGFLSDEETIPQLEKLAANYEMFQRLIVVPQLESVAGTYLELVREAVQ